MDKGKLIDYVSHDNGHAILPFAAAQLEHQMEKATVKDVAVALDMIIETIGCPTPSEMALQVYYGILTELPRCLIEILPIKIMTTYRYKSMPNPSDLLRSIDEEKEELARKYNTITSLIKHLDALEMNRRENEKHLALSRQQWQALTQRNCTNAHEVQHGNDPDPGEDRDD